MQLASQSVVFHDKQLKLWCLGNARNLYICGLLKQLVKAGVVVCSTR